MAAFKQLENKEHTLKSSPVKLLSIVVDKLGRDHPEVLVTGAVKTITEFDNLVGELQQERLAAKTWALAGWTKKFESAMKRYQEAVELAREIVRQLESLKTVRLLEVRSLAGDRRKIALTSRRLLKPLTQNKTFFKSLVSYFGEHIMGVTADATRLSPQASKNLCEGAWKEQPSCSAKETTESDAEVAMSMEHLLLVGGAFRLVLFCDIPFCDVGCEVLGCPSPCERWSRRHAQAARALGSGLWRRSSFQGATAIGQHAVADPERGGKVAECLGKEQGLNVAGTHHSQDSE